MMAVHDGWGGFSLVELLVLVAIVLLLAVLVMPVFLQGVADDDGFPDIPPHSSFIPHDDAGPVAVERREG